MEMNDLVVIGAGPAGSAAAISAARRRLRVVLLESGRYPRHKVCGEFVSAEAAEVLRYLGISHLLNPAPRIALARLHSRGTMVSMHLSDPAYSIPRFQLDDVLWNAAAEEGIDCRLETATSVSRADESFTVATSSGTIHARAVINASGRWSRISADTAHRGPAWIGLKAHFAAETDDAVDLYFFNNGYCGVQAVAPGVLNACALVRQGTVRDLKDVFAQDAALCARASRWKQTTETFATAPVYLGFRSPIRDGIFQVGDAAGFVDPFVGDGISLALRSGVLAGRTVLSDSNYAALYENAFSGIFRASRFVRSALAISGATRPLLLRTVRLPGVSHRVFRSTRASAFDVLGSSIPL